MLRAAGGPPVDYRLADRTVTIYHLLGQGSGFACTRTVFRGAFLEWKTARDLQKTGSRGERSFLLVLPSGRGARPVWADPAAYAAMAEEERARYFTLAPGDKVLAGEGAEISDRESWAALLPTDGRELAVVQSVEPKHWSRAVCHVEAGG